jgi:hypothetical protein
MTKRKILSRHQLTDEQKQKQHAGINAWRVRNAKKAGALVSENSYIDIPENTDILISEERVRKVSEAKLQEELKAAKVEQIRLKRIAYLKSIGQAVEE